MAKNKKSSGGGKVFKRIELVGVSSDGYEAAISNAVRRASKTLKDLRWFEVKEMRGAIGDGDVIEYQVVVVLNFEVH